jgi:hypothetical protein
MNVSIDELLALIGIKEVALNKANAQLAAQAAEIEQLKKDADKKGKK